MLDTNHPGVTSNGEACRESYLWGKRDLYLDVFVLESGIDVESHSSGADVRRVDLELPVCDPYSHWQVHFEPRNAPSVCIHETPPGTESLSRWTKSGNLHSQRDLDC